MIKSIYILFSLLKNIDNCKLLKSSNLYTKAIEWGTKQFPFPLLRVVSTSLFFVMPTEECTYVQNSFDFEMFANLHRFNYKKIVFK